MIHHHQQALTAKPVGIDNVAAVDSAHPRHHEIFGDETDADRPHRFWRHYNTLLVRHSITAAMLEESLAEEKARRGGGALLREGFAELLGELITNAAQVNYMRTSC